MWSWEQLFFQKAQGRCWCPHIFRRSMSTIHIDDDGQEWSCDRAKSSFPDAKLTVCFSSALPHSSTPWLIFQALSWHPIAHKGIWIWPKLFEDGMSNVQWVLAYFTLSFRGTKRHARFSRWSTDRRCNRWVSRWTLVSPSRRNQPPKLWGSRYTLAVVGQFLVKLHPTRVTYATPP